jgi:hypothetical protein
LAGYGITGLTVPGSGPHNLPLSPTAAGTAQVAGSFPSECPGGYGPAAVDVAQHVFGPKAHGRKKYLVEMTAPGDVDQWPNDDSVSVHRQDEHADAGLWLAGGRAGLARSNPKLAPA